MGTATSTEYNQAVKLASQVFDIVKTHQTPPNPKAYELLYSYASSDNPALCDSLNACFEKNGSLSVYDIDQLHNTHLRKTNSADQEAEKVSKKVEEELHDVMKLMQSSLTSNEGFSDTLDQARISLPNAGQPDQVHKIVEGLIAENQKMHHETEELSRGLTKSKNQIEKLHKHLEEARENSMRDPLTQLGNRRHFDLSLAAEMNTAKTTQEPLCLAIGDIDHFKRVNDTFGHLIGDGILRTFSAILSSSIKGQDTAARYGGEEFAIILPQTNPKDAYLLIEQIRKKIEASNLVIKNTGQEVGTVTASFGITQFKDQDTSDSIISRADANLYKAKKSGRNRIVIEQSKT